VNDVFEGFHYDDDFQLVLTIAGEEKKILIGGELRFSLSDEKYCVECGKEILHDSLCYECALADEKQACLKCDGSHCFQDDAEARAFCANNAYCVYLASFGSIVKAGVSLEERVVKRWVEQGADFGVKLASNLNGKSARVLETRLFAKGFREFVKASEKINVEAKQSFLENALAKLDSNEKIVSLASYHAVPNRISGETAELCGAVRGWKGPVLYLGNNAFLLSKAVGRKVTRSVPPLI